MSNNDNEYTSVDISKLSDEALRDRYREMRAWLIACLRGNNYDIDEDKLLHAIWPEDSEDYRRGIRTKHSIALGEPCGIARDVVVYLDDVKSGKLTPQQAIDSLEHLAEAGKWRDE